MKICWILATYRLDKTRKINLANHREFVSSQEGVDIDLHVMNQLDGIFNKQWLFNKGVRESQGEHLIFADVDVYHASKTYVRDFTEWTNKRCLRWGFGWNRLIYEGENAGDKPERVDWPEPGIQEGGVVYFQRSLWEEMGGANEWIRELRGPDNSVALAARYLTGQYMGYPVTLQHRWHSHSPMKQTRWRRLNKSILRYTRQNPEQVIAMLKSKKWGGAEPYCERESFFECRQAWEEKH